MPRPPTPPFKRSPRWTRADAGDAVAALRSSGLSIAAFALREGLDSSRLRKWIRRLEPATALVAAPSFVEIARGPSSHIEVVMPSGVTLRVAETVDPVALVRIVHALESSARC